MTSIRYTIQKQKEKFKINPTCTLINPTTREMGRINKIILDELTKDKLGLN